MPCFTGNIVKNQIIFLCQVFKSEDKQSSRQNQTAPLRALLDTGAQITCITQNVVDKVGIQPVSWGKMNGVGGTVDCPQYMVDIVISVAESKLIQDSDGKLQNKVQNVFGRGFSNTSVSMLSGSHEFDVLIGMDVIRQCHFTIHSGQQFTLCI